MRWLSFLAIGVVVGASPSRRPTIAVSRFASPAHVSIGRGAVAICGARISTRYGRTSGGSVNRQASAPSTSSSRIPAPVASDRASSMSAQ